MAEDVKGFSPGGIIVAIEMERKRQ